MKTVFIVMALFAALFAADGDLDPSFGDNGIVTTAIESASSAKSVAIQSDGKIVTAGYTWPGMGSHRKFALARHNTDGTLDAGFGSGGIVTTVIGTAEATAASVAIQSDGKIVVAGRTHWNNNYVFTLVRYNTDGTLDTGFGSGGIVRTEIDSYSHASSVMIQSDGKIVAAGSSGTGGFGAFTLVRYNTDGTLDTGFGSGGIIRTEIEDSSFAFSVAIQSDGKIIVAGISETGGFSVFALVRYNTDGTLDTGFGSDGIVITTEIIGFSVHAYSVAIQSDGKIVVAGNSDDSTSPMWGGLFDFALARYNTNGTLDTGFGSGGIVKTDIGDDDGERAHSIVIQSDGKIVAAGYASIGYLGAFALVRYNTDGTLDAGFGSGGIVTTEGAGSGQSVAIQGDGKIVLAGQYHFTLARYLAGSPNIAVTPTAITYGDLLLGESSEQNITVSNEGTAALTINSISITGSADFTQSSNCPTELPSATSCDVSVTFSPSTQGGASGSLHINSNDPDESPLIVPLSGNAITQPEYLEDIIAFYDDAVSSGNLVGVGTGKSADRRLKALRNMLVKALALLEADNITKTCKQLSDVYNRIDDDPLIPDFATGASREELAERVQTLMNNLGCE